MTSIAEDCGPCQIENFQLELIILRAFLDTAEVSTDVIQLRRQVTVINLDYEPNTPGY